MSNDSNENDPKDKVKKSLGNLFQKASSLFNQEKATAEETQESTKPSFQVDNFSDDDEEELIESTLKNIRVQEMQEAQEQTQEAISLDDESGYSEDEDEYDEGQEEYEDEDEDEDFPVFEELKIPAGQQGQQQVHSPITKKQNFLSKLRSKFARKPASSAGVGQSLNHFFSPENRPAIHRSFIFIFFIGSSILAARLITTLISPVSAPSKPAALAPLPNSNNRVKSDLNYLASTDLFQTKIDPKKVAPKKKAPQIDGNLVCTQAKRRSSEDIKLNQTIVLQDSVKSIASVQARGEKQYLRVGDRISGVAEIGHIDASKLIFKNLKTGVCEYVSSAKSGKPTKKFKVERNLKKAKAIIAKSKINGIKQEGNTFKIKKSLRDKMLSNVSSILTQAKAVPRKNPDGTYSFYMTEIVPGSIFSQLDVRDGDVINSINGKKMESLNEAMGYLTKLKTNNHFELSVTRNGQEQNLTYDFTD